MTRALVARLAAAFASSNALATPALYTEVLVQQGVSAGARYGYLALYNVAYILDDWVMFLSLLVDPPKVVPLLLRPALFLAERITGKPALPGRLLAHFPKGALGAGVFEAAAANPSDMDRPDGARVLAVTRIVASAVAGCPFCIDMNAATWKRAGLTPSELRALLTEPVAAVATLDQRSATAGKYAASLSVTPVVVGESLRVELREQFSAREIVVLATTIAQVNFWSRFSQGLGVPAAGFFDESACPVP